MGWGPEVRGDRAGRGAAFAFVAIAVAITGCGGGGSSSTTSKPSKTAKQATSAHPASAVRANQQFQAAVTQVNAARQTFITRGNPDAKAANVAAYQGDAAQYRTAVFNFDGTVRKISFPPSLQTDVNALLDANKTLISDLDAIGTAKTISEVNRLIARQNTDVSAQQSVGNKLYNEIGKMAGTSKNPSASAGSTGAVAGSSETSKLANALLQFKQHSGAKGPKDAECAAKMMVKKLSKADIQKIESGAIPQKGPVSIQIGASLVTCQAAAGTL